MRNLRWGKEEEFDKLSQAHKKNVVVKLRLRNGNEVYLAGSQDTAVARITEARTNGFWLRDIASGLFNPHEVSQIGVTMHVSDTLLERWGADINHDYRGPNI